MELEEELGKQLLVRGKRKVTLTEDGILLRKRAEEIVALLERTETELRSDISIEGGGSHWRYADKTDPICGGSTA